MKKVTFLKEENAEIVGRIRRYSSNEFEQTIGVLNAEFLLDVLVGEVGAHFYRQGL